MNLNKDVVVIGAGAAGMMCAIEAGKRGRSVLLLDHAPRLAEKIRISGGGRCNFTNLNVSPENFISSNSKFCCSALARFTSQDFVALIKKHGISYHEKKLGQLFCDDSSQQIIKMLHDECHEAGVVWQTPSQVERIELVNVVQDSNARFALTTNRNRLVANAVVISTGGLSIPKIGASAFGYQVARQFGIAVTSLSPALVGLNFSTKDLACFAEISGVTIDAVVSCNGASFRENILFTHRGLSGPAILQISSYWNPGDVIHINLLPQYNVIELFFQYKNSSRLLANVLAQYLPKRFIQAWVKSVSGVLPEIIKPINQYSDDTLRRIVEKVQDWVVAPTGTMGYKKAEVTRGGVDTQGLSSKTMEAKKVAGLYFIGEVVDVTGHLGGYNFQWAWSSGYAAGQYV